MSHTEHQEAFPQAWHAIVSKMVDSASFVVDATGVKWGHGNRSALCKPDGEDAEIAIVREREQDSCTYRLDLKRRGELFEVVIGGGVLKSVRINAAEADLSQMGTEVEKALKYLGDLLKRESDKLASRKEPWVTGRKLQTRNSLNNLLEGAN